MNIMLVEDEPPILRDISYIIESFQKDYTIYATASDGQTAIEMLQAGKDHIDVLITDIHLPLVDGLELISFVRNNMPHIYCIIISGYSEFDYAKKAVKLKVSDYLLKPINESELNSLLEQIYDKWCMNYFEKGNLTYAPSLPAEKEFYVYCPAILCLGPLPVSDNNPGTYWQEQWDLLCLDNLFSSQPWIHKYYISPGACPCEKNLLFVCKKTSLPRNQLFSFLNEFLADQVIQITAVIGYLLSTPSCVFTELTSMHLYLTDHIVLEHSLLLYYDRETRCHGRDSLLLSNDLERLQKLFHDSNSNLFDTELLRFLLKLEDLGLSQAQLAKNLKTLLDMCTSQHKTVDFIYQLSSGETVQKCMYQANSYQKLYEELQEIFHQIFDCIYPKPLAENRTTLLRHIDAYITKFCYEPINTKSIAEKFGFTPAYLSKIYQDYKHISPMDYILQLRLEKAKELFECNPELMIKDVSNYVGYADSLYFSKVFKRYTGMSPKEYLNNIRNERKEFHVAK